MNSPRSINVVVLQWKPSSIKWPQRQNRMNFVNNRREREREREMRTVLQTKYCALNGRKLVRVKVQMDSNICNDLYLSANDSEWTIWSTASDLWPAKQPVESNVAPTNDGDAKDANSSLLTCSAELFRFVSLVLTLGAATSPAAWQRRKATKQGNPLRISGIENAIHYGFYFLRSPAWLVSFFIPLLFLWLTARS